MSDYISVKKETVKKLIIITNESQNLSEKLEENNQETRVLLHALVKEAKNNKRRMSDPMQKLLSTPGKAKAIKTKKKNW